MRFPQTLALALLAAAPFTGTAAVADDVLFLTPPLYREQARALQRTPSASDLTTTPQPVAAASPKVASRTVQIVADAAARAE